MFEMNDFNGNDPIKLHLWQVEFCNIAFHLFKFCNIVQYMQNYNNIEKSWADNESFYVPVMLRPGLGNINRHL